jgi:hypothetical protein
MIVTYLVSEGIILLQFEDSLSLLRYFAGAGRALKCVYFGDELLSFSLDHASEVACAVHDLQSSEYVVRGRRPYQFESFWCMIDVHVRFLAPYFPGGLGPLDFSRGIREWVLGAEQ